MDKTVANDKRKTTLIQLKNVILILLIIIDLIFIISISFFDIGIEDLVFMAYFDLFVCFILFLNLISLYMQSNDSLLKFIRSHIIDIISIIPFNFIFLRYLAVFRIVRILQFFQIIRVFNIKKINANSVRYFIQNQLLQIISLILLIYIIVSVISLYALDNSFYTLFDAVWYLIVTISGVGYGDIVPSSYAGKIIGILTVILGVFFISIFTAAMSGVYMEKTEKITRDKLKHEIKKSRKENYELKNKLENLEEKMEQIDKKLNKLLEE